MPAPHRLGASPPPGIGKPPKVAPFVVLIRDRVAFRSETQSEAFAWRDGFGAGAVYERCPTPQNGGAA